MGSECKQKRTPSNQLRNWWSQAVLTGLPGQFIKLIVKEAILGVWCRDQGDFIRHEMIRCRRWSKVRRATCIIIYEKKGKNIHPLTTRDIETNCRTYDSTRIFVLRMCSVSCNSQRRVQTSIRDDNIREAGRIDFTRYQFQHPYNFHECYFTEMRIARCNNGLSSSLKDYRCY